MKIALYKGPPSFNKDPIHWLTHYAILIRTMGKYSHTELLIDGNCYSSSARDGGVRSKKIDLRSGKWDVVEVNGDEQKALAFMIEHLGNPYDWWGIVRFIVPFVPQKDGQYFCFEIVAAALKAAGELQDIEPHNIFPRKLLSLVSKK